MEFNFVISKRIAGLPADTQEILARSHPADHGAARRLDCIGARISNRAVHLHIVLASDDRSWNFRVLPR